MKRFLLVLVLLMFAGSVFAAELKITGDAHVRGSWSSSKEKGSDREHNAFYDYDFNLNAALKANDAATVYLKLTYDKNVDGKGTVADGSASATDAGLAVERAYINYKFAPFLQLNTGLMAGGQWASAFGNDEINVMRVQAIGALSKDMIFIATVQKNDENGLWDSEKRESDAFYLSSILRFGNITVLPLFTWITDRVAMDRRINQYAFTLGLNGDFGMLGLESEFFVATVDSNDQISDDPTLFGAYVNVFAKPVDNIKVGVAGAYASSHKKSGISYYYGDDFDFTMVVDDWGWGSQGGLPGMMSGKVYVEATVLPKLTVDAAFAYGVQANKNVMKFNAAGGAMGGFAAAATIATIDALGGLAALPALVFGNYITQDEADAYEIAYNEAAGMAIGKKLSYWEIDLGATWAFDDNTSYRIAGGYAGMKADGQKSNDFRIEHKIQVKF